MSCVAAAQGVAGRKARRRPTMGRKSPQQVQRGWKAWRWQRWWYSRPSSPTLKLLPAPRGSRPRHAAHTRHHPWYLQLHRRCQQHTADAAKADTLLYYCGRSVSRCPINIPRSNRATEVQARKIDCFRQVCCSSRKRDEGTGHAAVMPSERSSWSSGAGGSEARAPPACCAGSVVPHADFLAALRAVVRPAGMLCGSGRRRLGGRRGEPCGCRRLRRPFICSARWEVRRGWLPRLAVGVNSGDPCQE